MSAGGELAEPAGEVDSCLEQADRSASEPTHNNRTLRFIRTPHYCNGTVTTGLVQRWPCLSGRSQAAFRKLMPGSRPRLRRPAPRPGILCTFIAGVPAWLTLLLRAGGSVCRRRS